MKFMCVLSLLLWRMIMGQLVEYQPEDCLEVTFAGCYGMQTAEPFVNGVYEIYAGDCTGAIGAAAYYNIVTEYYMYKHPTLSWIISATCGGTSAKAYGDASHYPFLDTAPSWLCSNNPFTLNSVTVTCSLYDGQPVPCNSGTFSPTGVAPNGYCSDKCPSNLTYSPKGSTSISQCLTLYNNIYAVSLTTKRVTAFNSNTKQFELVTEAGVIDEPRDMEFITDNLALVSSATKQRVNMIDSEGIDHGVFAMVTTPVGILHLPHLNLVAIASKSLTYKRVYFFNLDDFTGTPLQTSDATSITTSTLGADEPQYLSLGELPDEILITTYDNKVVRMCIPHTGCKMRNAVMVKNGQDFEGIAVIPARESYIVADRDANKLFECPLTTTNTNVNTACTVFAYKPASVHWDPRNLVADHTKQLIYVADYLYHKVHVMTFNKDYLGPLHDSFGALMGPIALVIKAGPLPSLSLISPPATATAGSPINVPLTLRDAYNNPLPDSYPIADELPLYQITATGLRDGQPTTLTGLVSSSTVATITIDYAGVWNATVISSLANPQTLHNAPFQITVDPAPTDPASCEAEFENVLTAGNAFALTLSPFDSFSNPTSHPDDSFEAYFSSSPSIRSPLTRSSNSFTFSSSPMTIASSYRLHVLHNDAEVAYSPFNLNVSPAPPSPLDCEQSLEGITTFDPSTGGNLTLQVFAFDEFKNLVPDTDRLSVVIDGDINSNFPLLPPTYTHKLHFPKDEERQMKIGFLYAKNGGYQHLPGSPVLIQVAPPPPADTFKTEIAALVAGVLAVASLVFCCLYGQMQRKLNSKRKVERIEREAELNLTVDEKLAKDFTGKIYKQKAFLVYEIVDGLGDVAKPFYYLAASSMARDQPWLLGLLFIVALSATFTSYYSIRTRKKVMSQMNGVVDGDLLHVYAEGVFSEEETGVVGKDNLVMKLDTVNLDLALEEMNQRSIRFEAIPSLVVFMIELFTFSNKAEFSVLNALLSAIMIGTKMNGKSSDLTSQKGDLEDKLSKLRGVKGRRGSRMSLMAGVFGEGAAKLREEEARIDEKADEHELMELRQATRTTEEEEEKREIELPGQMNDIEEGQPVGGGSVSRREFDAVLQELAKKDSVIRELEEKFKSNS